jgi:hypothetical protein
MSLSANYNVGFRKLFDPSTPKQQCFGDPFSVRSRQLVQVDLELHAVLDLKNLLESLTLLLCG